MTRRLFPALAATALALATAACERSPSPAPDADDLAAPPPLEVPDAAALPGEFVVLTNEPFWQARVDAAEVVLTGPEEDGRRLRVESANDADGARIVHARDEAGAIIVTLLPGPCEDSMSGAVFPHAAQLTIDGIGPTPGCARPAGTPLPQPPGA